MRADARVGARRRLAAIVLLAAGVTASPARAAPAAPDLDLLEYLGRLEQQEGRWVGPDDMASATPEDEAAARRQARVDRQAPADKRPGAPASTSTPTEGRQHVD